MVDKNNAEEFSLGPTDWNVTIEHADQAIYNHIDCNIDLRIEDNAGWRKVPVVFSTFEKAFVAEKFKDYRDSTGALIYPIVSLKRVGIKKDPTDLASYMINQPAIDSVRRGNIPVRRRLNVEKTEFFRRNHLQKSKSKGPTFAVGRRKSDKKVYDVEYAPHFRFVELKYEIKIRTSYIQHMNDMLQSFIASSDNNSYFIVREKGYSYECFYDFDMRTSNNESGSNNQERYFETTIGLSLLAYTVGSGKNQTTPLRAVHQTVADIAFKTEIVRKSKVKNNSILIPTTSKYVGSEIAPQQTTILRNLSLEGIMFTLPISVPSATDTLYFYVDGHSTLSAGPSMSFGGEISSASITVDVADSNADYRIEILIENAVIASFILSRDNRTAMAQFSAATFVAEDELKARIVRTSGSGKSSFENAVLNLTIQKIS